MISGTQGEPMSALSRAAVDNHKHAKIESGDTVVLSRASSPATKKPSTGWSITSSAARRTSSTTMARIRPIHVSGHASQEELKLIINLVKPQIFHSDPRRVPATEASRRIGAAAMHGAVGQVMMIESGDVLEFDELGARKAGKVAVGRICIDSNSMGDVVEELIIRDRRHISEDGIVLPIIAINKLTGRVETPPRS